MNQLLSYEQVIADKLNHTAIPDMTDEIWASIETELGPDSSANDGGGNNSPASTSPGIAKISWMKILIVTVIAVVIVLLIVKKRNTNNDKQINTPVVPAIEKSINKDCVVLSNSLSQNPAISTNNEINNISIEPMIIDSTAEPILLSDPSLLKNQADSIAKPLQVITLPIDNPIILKPDEKPKVPEKKGRGANGIKDTDYKIVSKNKDSL